MPDFDLLSNLWLFRHLTQTLDLRMLQVLIHNDDSTIDSSISINLNVKTILSPEFINFDNSLDVKYKPGVFLQNKDFLRGDNSRLVSPEYAVKLLNLAEILGGYND